MIRAQGIDISVWNDENSTPQMVDLSVAKKAGASFVFIKASQIYADGDFLLNWKNAKAAGILRGAYHFLDWRTSEIDQAKLFAGLIGSDPGELPPVLDLEMDPSPYNLSYQSVINKVRNFLSMVELSTGRIPIIYCGYYYWTAHMDKNIFYSRYPLWLAWYAKETVIKVPYPWNAWTFWQYSSQGDGRLYGCESQYVDLNWFNGTLDELKKFASVSLPLPAPSICSCCGQTLSSVSPPASNAYKVTAALLNIRSGPGTNYSILGTLPFGTIVEALESDGGWAKCDKGWLSYSYLLKV
jgi:lysozyme